MKETGYQINNTGCKILVFDGMWILYDLFTKRDSRKRGGATMIIKKVISDFKQSNETALLARTIKDNKPYRIFKRLGFIDIATNDRQHVIQCYPKEAI